MCVGLPGQVVEVLADRPGFARVSVQGTLRLVGLGLLDGDPPRPGDWVLIQLGLALERMTEAEATEAIRLLEALGAATEDDLFLDLEAALAEARAAPQG